MRLHGRQWTRREIEARIGGIAQIGGVRRLTLTEGREAGTELIEVRTGAGLALEIAPSKGLDISLAQLWGTPISWQSPNGNAHPALYEPEGTGWLRTASGGLLMTCGLAHVGSPSRDESGSYGLHGRAHHTPARSVGIREEWIGDELHWSVFGVVEETAIFGSKLRLTRKLSGRLGDNRVEIRDRVENFGFRPAEHMMLYHFNFGFPLLDERTEIRLPEADREVRAGGPATLDSCASWEAPNPDAAETVYYHSLKREAVGADGMAEARIVQPEFPAAAGPRPTEVALRWSADTLPLLVQWRMPGAGEHVLGLEPANCRVEGREAERRRGGTLVLAPGQSVDYRLELNAD
ncbi:DUF4432 family protein [Cohnella cellulosilytica]|uniref:DUF4432 family protein n=1 Tax=Cohnella cellulosilytica TaxID=986710 RepID=A0ABW2FC25_9BACL